MQRLYSIGVLIGSIGNKTILFQLYVITYRFWKGLKFIMDIIKIDVEDEKYPQRLLKILNFPTEIYAVGNIELLNAEYTVGIVGARKCTEYGSRVANEFAKKLSEKEICVISGMAVGIDGIAHNAAIDEQGKTIAVLGSGLNYIYPPENEWLFHKIIEKGGCIISEYSPETEPDNKKYPTRNRIISGLSDAVLVVEAMHRSGSTITAKYAREERKLVYAIPNTIYVSTGVGTNRLIQKGAILATDPMQIVLDLKAGITVGNDGNLTVEVNGELVKVDYSKLLKSRRNRESSKAKSKEDKSNEDNSEKDLDLNGESEQAKIKKQDEIEKIGDKESKEKLTINQLMSKEELEIYRVLSDEPVHINELAKKLGKPVYEVSPAITMMEINGYVEQPQTNYFRRNI